MRKKKVSKICKVEDCDRSIKGLGYCLVHYTRVRRHGNPYTLGKPNRGSSHKRIYKSIEQRFDANHQPVTESGCWLWTGSTGSKGYGEVNWANKRNLAHRLSFERYKGSIPDGHFVCHKCDIPSCVNPDHLFIGTPLDNFDDMRSKARHSHGERSGRSKLSELDVKKIRSLNLRRGDSTRICEIYGIAQTSLQKIKTRKHWTRI